MADWRRGGSLARLLSLSRSTAYYQPQGESEENLAVMKEIDRLYMERPTSESRTIRSRYPR